MAAACSSASSSALRTQLGAVKWIHIPYQVPYLHGLALQERIVERRLQAKQLLEEQPSASPSTRSAGNQSLSKQVQEAQKVAWQDYLLLQEHTPVYTEGRRKGAKSAIGDDEEGKRLRALGADYIVAQRGGLITFHGPGQIVGYPILDISRMNNLSTRCYVDKMQTCFRDLLDDKFQIKTVSPPDEATGVWTDEMHKILSIGIQVRQRITSHGFALNVKAQPLLSWFKHIVACGIVGKHMTSIERQLALRIQEEEQARPDREAAPQSEKRVENANMLEIEPGLQLGPESVLDVQQVSGLVAQQVGKTYQRDMELATEDDFRFEAGSNGVVDKIWFAGEEVHPMTSA
jgi:lipoate-protein ligase B